MLLSEDFGHTEPDLPIWKDLTVALLLNTRSFSCIDPAGIHHAASATTRTDTDILVPDKFQDLGDTEVFIPAPETLSVL